MTFLGFECDHIYFLTADRCTERFDLVFDELAIETGFELIESVLKICNSVRDASSHKDFVILMLKGIIEGEIVKIGGFFDSTLIAGHLSIIFNFVSPRRPISCSPPAPDVGPKPSLKERVALPEAEDVEPDLALLVIFD